MEYLNIIIATVFVNNILISQFMGLNATLASSNDMGSAFSMAMATSIITTIVAILAKLVHDNILVVLNMKYLNLLVYVLIVTIIITIYNNTLKSINNNSFSSLQRFVPNVVANTLTLGIGLIVVNMKQNLLETLIYAIGVSLGFTLTLILISAINDKYRYSTVPRQFRENALTLISLGLISLAFYGFKGLI